MASKIYERVVTIQKGPRAYRATYKYLSLVMVGGDIELNDEKSLSGN